MKKYIKILVDFGMTVLLLMLMAYERVGAAAHEWLGIALFLLVVLHHVLNRKWSGNLLNGRYRPMRIAQTVLVALVLCAMLGSMASGIVLSRHALAFLPVRGGASWARTVHMLCGYWGFLLMGLHLGLHWGMIAGMISRHIKTSPLLARVSRIAGIAAAVYGTYALFKRGLPDYLFLRNHFAFFDFSEPLVLLLLDYLAIMGAFVWVGHYLVILLNRLKGQI